MEYGLLKQILDSFEGWDFESYKKMKDRIEEFQTMSDMFSLLQQKVEENTEKYQAMDHDLKDKHTQILSSIERIDLDIKKNHDTFLESRSEMEARIEDVKKNTKKEFESVQNLIDVKYKEFGNDISEVKIELESRKNEIIELQQKVAENTEKYQTLNQDFKDKYIQFLESINRIGLEVKKNHDSFLESTSEIKTRMEAMEKDIQKISQQGSMFSDRLKKIQIVVIIL